MRNLIIASIVLAVGAFLFISWTIKRDVAESVDMAVMMMAPYAVVQYEGVSATLTGELTVDGVRARVKGFDDEFYIDRIGIDTPSFLTLMKLGDMDNLGKPAEDILPRYFGMMIEGFRMPVDADIGRKLYAARLEELGVEGEVPAAARCTGKYGFSPASLAAMGYDDYELSLSARFRQRDSGYAIEIDTSSEDMWQADAELVLVGNMLTEFAKGSRYRPRMSELRIEYTDRSMNERMARHCKQLGLSDDEIRAAMLDSFKFMGKDNGIEFDEYVLDPFNEFLAGGKTLVVTAKPHEPVTLSQISLYKPEDVPALLQLSAEAQ